MDEKEIERLCEIVSKLKYECKGCKVAYKDMCDQCGHDIVNLTVDNVIKIIRRKRYGKRPSKRK